MKRILALVLALAMLLPAMGVAESGIGAAYENGKQISAYIGATIDEALVDAETAAMVNNLSLVVTAQKDPQQVGIAVLYGETEVFCVELESGEDTVFVRSHMLGEQTLKIAKSDLEPLMKRATQYAVNKGMISQEDADEFLASMEAALQVQPDAQTAEPEEIELTPEQEQQIIAALSDMDVAPVLEAVVAVLDKVEIVEENIEQPESDKAVSMLRANLNGEDLKLVLQAFIATLESSDGLVAMLAEADLDLKDAEIRAAIDAVIEQLAASVTSLAFDVYLGEDDGVVYFSATPAFLVEGDELKVSIVYARNTADGAIRYATKLGMAVQPAEGEYTELFDAELAYEALEDGGVLSFKTGETELKATITKTAQPMEGGEYTVWQIACEALSAGQSAGMATLVADSFVSDPQDELPMTAQSLSLFLNGDEAPCAALVATAQALGDAAASFAGEGTVEPMALTDEEFDAFMTGAMESLVNWISGVETALTPAEQ